MELYIKRFYPLAIVAALVVAIILGINYYSSHVGTIIVADIIPKDSTVKLDDKKPGKVGNIKTFPGEHTLLITRKGFSDKTIKITIAKNEHKQVRKMLAPNSEVGYEWSKKHPKEVARGESFAGDEFNENSQKALERTPIIKKLPFIDQFYRIDYGRSRENPDDITATAIYITYYSEGGKAEALDMIKFWGYDPANLEIIFRTGTGDDR